MSAPPFNWNDLRFFLAVARSRTISLAGRRTGTDHATVGRRISALEAALGLQLFERNPRGYNLTQHGEALLGMASAMEAEAVKIEETVAGQQEGLTGAIRISTPEGFGNFFLASRIGALAAAHPRLAVEMITIQQIVALSRREADVAVTMTLPAGGNFVHEHLTDYRLFVYASRDYLAAAPPILSRDDLGDHPFIGYVDDLIFTRALNYLPEIRPHLRARLQNSSLHAQLSATVAGYGLCVLPAYVACTAPDLIAVLPGEVSLKRSYWMVADSDMAETAQVRLTQRFLRSLLAEAGDFFTRLPKQL
ncbi:LysR family transcriptional regulator [Sphingomonas sp. Root710]|uniref:LysR family transcriptional regulator n=1 Tax=Sphingomonas sp. Root710 TaxID=1736594 RepID=UPI000701FD83|nr:LysR family transcriptional regulator [Sphingomonas sp. Root710]KRB82387.1 LysR family transcriptional regulator [Sphingomonas sp. Root710]